MIYSIALIGILITAWITKPIKASQRRQLLFVVFFLGLALLSGFRYQNEASDFRINYNRVIQAEEQSWSESLHYSSEIIHQLLRKVIGESLRDPQWYFILSAAFIVWMSLSTFKKYAYSLFLCVLLFFVEFGYFSSNNLTRQSIAVAVCLCSWKYIFKRNKVRFFMVIVCAMLIHMSAVFFIPIYFLSEIDFNRKSILIYTIGGMLILAFNRQIMAGLQVFLYSNYDESSYGMTPSNVIRLGLAVLCGIMMLVFTIRKEANLLKTTGSVLQTKSYYDNFILNGTYIFILCTVLSSIRVLMFSRIALYYSPCAILCIDNAVGKIQNVHSKRIVFSGLILFCIIWFSVKNYMGKYIPTPYTPFWEFPYRPLISSL